MADALSLLTGTSAASASASASAAAPGAASMLEKAARKRRGGGHRATGGAKAAGMNRELFALLPDGITSIAPAPAAVFKEKPKLGKGKAASWVWRPFTNSARKDGLQLSHWVRADDTATDYPYAKFNRHVSIVQYTDDEYQTHFEDPEWTREDTDRLFELCVRLDLRFPVIADRLEGNRSIEDVKARYYSITRKLIELRNDKTDPLVQAELAKYAYDKEREVERKAQLDRLLRRTPDQVREEQYLLIEARKLEASAKRLLKERQTVVQLLSAIDSAFAPSRATGPRGMTAEQTSKLLAQRQRRPAKGYAYEEIPVEDPSSAGEGSAAGGVGGAAGAAARKKEKMPMGAFLRSSRLVLPVTMGTKMAKRIDQQLTELGLPLRPAVPTLQVCDLFEDVRQDIVTLMDLKKHVDRREYDVAVLNHRREALITGKDLAALPPPPESADDADEPTGPAVRKRLSSTADARDGSDVKRPRP